MDRDTIYDVPISLVKRHFGTIRTLKLIAQMAGREAKEEEHIEVRKGNLVG